jgi:hypothetical protein
MWGYLDLGNNRVESAYKSLQLFHFHFDTVPGGVGSIHWNLQVARFGAGLWELAFFPALAGLFFKSRILAWYRRLLWHDHFVVWGHCTRTLSLVLDLHREGKRVVFIGHCPIPRGQLPWGVFFLESSDAREAPLRQAALSRARQLVALNESDTENLEILVAAERVCTARSRSRAPLECAAHFADTYLEGGLYRSVIATGSQAVARTRQHLFNYYEIMAGVLARQHPLSGALAKGTPAVAQHFVIVGFAAFGQCVARKLVKMGLQLYREGDAWKVRKTRITIVDRLGEKATQAFLLSYPKFTQYCDFDVLPMDCDDASFLDLRFLAPEPQGDRSAIVLCLENETVTLRTLLLLRESARQFGRRVDTVCVRFARPERLGTLFSAMQADNAGPRVMLFAPDSEVFNADVLLNRSLDVLARQMHEAYLKVAEADARANNRPPAAGTPWEQLSQDDQEGSREAVDHTWTKLATLGYELRAIPPGQTAMAPDSALLDELKSLEETLARVEHERWMAWRLLNGWRWGAVRDQKALLHPDLVDYDLLAETTKEKDRIIIRAIPDLLREGRLQIVQTGPAPPARGRAAAAA